MKNFIHKYGHIILWLIFIIFMFISLMVLVTQGIVYALVIFVPSLIFLCPPIIKFIQRKTRLKKVVLGIFATIVMSFALFGTSRHSAALKEENIRINQEKRKEDQERKSLEEQKRTEEQQKNEEEKKSELAAANKKAETKQKKDKEDKEDKDTKSTDKEKAEQTKDKEKSQVQQSQAQKQVQPQQKAKKVVVRASKKSGQYYTPGHPSYNKVAPNNVVVYSSEEAAARAGYKKAA
ncbi:sunset domain-containing protein [Gemella sanguinis]|uniref:N-acetylmuramoyl-L-alanine amidase n=1 Tax=Gemella sanguinis TaxID=84135 RepID=A0A2N6SDX0_9BACL|nr:N-acetylmuramoyl-L-alanine amidase [Gemella sanguinis]PMC52148.1 N-acetylmuramoyl-L-alanine amidase [Gemella sanguinis]